MTMYDKTLSFDDFKTMIKTNNDFKESLTSKSDIIDLDNGVMRIHSENLNKYLEKYACKDAEELEDTLYYSYGIYCTVIP